MRKTTSKAIHVMVNTIEIELKVNTVALVLIAKQPMLNPNTTRVMKMSNDLRMIHFFLSVSAFTSLLAKMKISRKYPMQMATERRTPHFPDKKPSSSLKIARSASDIFFDS